jgi:hypothetical protein
MKQVLDAFRAPMKDGSAVTPITAAEFNTFWKSLTDDEKITFKANAAEMGFVA